VALPNPEGAPPVASASETSRKVDTVYFVHTGVDGVDLVDFRAGGTPA